MVNAQEWLDQNYPPKKREYAEEVCLLDSSLEGELDLGDFTCEWLKVYVSSQMDKNKLVLKNLPKDADFIKLCPAQEWLNKYYPENGVCQIEEEDNESEWNNYGKIRKEIVKLNVSRKDLEGSLDLSDFINLREFCCQGNKLTFLNLVKCNQLGIINCSNNYLTNLALPINPINLKSLDLSNNKFSDQDLSFLTEATNLEEIDLENNNFSGSLEPLQRMNNLKKLRISCTQLDEGLEYLTPKLQKLYCLVTNKIIYQQIRSTDNDLMQWRKTNRDLLIRVRETNILGNLYLALLGHHCRDEITEKGLKIFIWEEENRIKEKVTQELKAPDLEAKITSLQQGLFLRHY